MEKDKNHLSDEQIAIYAEAIATDTSVNLSDDIKRHVKYCKECTDSIQTVSEIIREDYKNSIADGLNSIKKHKDISIETWIGIAASIIIIATLGYLLTTKKYNANNDELLSIDSTLYNANNIVYNDKPIDSSFSTAQNDIKTGNNTNIKKATDSIIKHKSLEVSLAFNSNKELESLVRRFQGNSMRSNEITIITPPNAKFSKNDSINLKWNNTNKQYLTIEIFNNKGQKIIYKTSSKNIVNISEITKSGLYYWKLLNEDNDLLYCGKIKYIK